MPDSVSVSDTSDVVTRLIEEGPIGMSAAAKLCGSFRQGKPTRAGTVARWCMRGTKLGDGRVLKLESFRLNDRLCTSKQALIRFIRAQNEPAMASELPAIQTAAARSRQAQAAAAELDALGIG
jgi:hypothetical protein